MEEYLYMLKRGKPKTSAPSVTEFYDKFEIALRGDANKRVLCITLADALSGTYNSARLAAEEFPGQVSVVNSKSVSLGEYFLLERARTLIARGLELTKVEEHLVETASRLQAFLLPKTLAYAYRGGRVNGAVFAATQIMDIKVLLSTDPRGVLKKHDAYRTWSRALDGLVENIKAIHTETPLEKLGIIYIDTPAEAAAVASVLEEELHMPVLTSKTGTVLATHSGPGSLGAVLLKGNGD